MPECRFCGEEILAVAKKCRHCDSWLVERPKPSAGDLPWVKASIGVLIFCGVAYVLLGFAFVPFMEAIEESDGRPMPEGMKAIMYGVMILFGGGFGVLNFVAAWGLSGGKKWSWYMASIIGAIYLPSICFPFGGVVLYALLKEDGRRAFGVSQ